MAWTINRVGSITGVIAEITAAKSAPADEVAQLERAKAMIVAEIEALPADCNGCRVDAAGNANKQGRTLQVSVMPMKFSL